MPPATIVHSLVAPFRKHPEVRRAQITTAEVSIVIVLFTVTVVEITTEGGGAKELR
jgi:hypothetical protein